MNVQLGLAREERRRISVANFGFAALIAVIFSIQLYFLVVPDYVHEEFRLLFRYHVGGDDGLFRGDYLASFVNAFPQPYLYEFLTRLWLWAGGELAIWHRLLPLACWIGFLAGVAAAARRLGGTTVVVGAVGVAVAQPIYLFQITSALPHAFAFPLLVWALVAMLYGAERGLMLVTVLSGLTYPAVTPIIGLCLAWQVLIVRRPAAAPGRDRLASLVMLGVVGAASIWLVLGAMGGPDDFGAALKPWQQVETYPENGPGGRHFHGIFSPLEYVFGKSILQFRTSDPLVALSLLLIYCAVAVLGLAALPRENGARRTFLVFLAASASCMALVFVLGPFYLYRFVLYPGFTALPLLFAFGVWRCCLRGRALVRAPEAAAFALLAAFALACDGFDRVKIGYGWHIEREQRAVLDFAAGRPPETRFALWPGSDNPLELIPYIARRPLFVMYKAHYPTYENHILAMRKRTRALIAAYLATDVSPLIALHDRWGVDYLIVDRLHFRSGDVRPRYFAPFDARIEAIWREHRPADFLLANPDKRWSVLRTDRYVVIDLKAVSASARAPVRTAR